MKCLVVSFEVSMGLVLLLAAFILILGVMFLCCWRIGSVCLVLFPPTILGESVPHL